VQANQARTLSITALPKGVVSMNKISRRHFVAGAGALATFAAIPIRAFATGSHFKIGVISDEISQDFDHACYVIAKEYGLQWVELRAMWGKKSAGDIRRPDRRGAEDSFKVRPQSDRHQQPPL
jgi:hypothetical protein